MHIVVYIVRTARLGHTWLRNAYTWMVYKMGLHHNQRSYCIDINWGPPEGDSWDDDEVDGGDDEKEAD